MRHGSLFSGIGGFDLAAEWMGWENVFHCEINEFGRKVLNYHFPKSISHEDITKTDFSVYRGRIDILSGGFPCQPFSSAGNRLGKEDERHLWPQMLRAIKEIAPSWIVGENVYGLINWSNGLVFHEIQADLEAQGYEVFPFLCPAVSVNAPHVRNRIFFIAHSRKFRLELSKTSGIMGERQAEVCGERSEFALQSTSTSKTWNSAYSELNSKGQNIGADTKEAGAVRWDEESNVFGTLCGDGSITNSNYNGLQQQWGYECRCQNDERSISQSQWSTDSENSDNGYTSEYVNGKPDFSGRIGSERYSEKGETTDTRGVRWMDKKCDKCQGIIKEYWDTTNQSGTLVQNGQVGVQLPINSRMGDNQTTIEPDRRDEHQDDYNNIEAMDRDATDTISFGHTRITETTGDNKSEFFGGMDTNCGWNGDEIRSEIERCGSSSPDTCDKGLQGDELNGTLNERKWEQGFTRIPIAKFHKISDWSEFPTVPPVCVRDDGFSNRLDGITFPKWRNESIKAAGNAVVPQVILQIFKTIADYERITTTD